MSDSILLTNGILKDPKNHLDTPGEILIENGVISEIYTESTTRYQDSERIQKIDLSGGWILPAPIDAHVHLREPGLTHKETLKTGSQAALAGGFTQIACMANTLPVNDTAETTRWILEKASEDATECKIHPIGAVTKGLQGETLADIEDMVKAGAVAISDDGKPVMNSRLMRQAMEIARSCGIAVISHAEDAHLSYPSVMNEGLVSQELNVEGNPCESEEILVAREIALSRLTGCRVHLAHVSSRLSLPHIRRAKEDGLPITAEVCPHHLFLTEKDVPHYQTHCKMAPPLRTQEDCDALIDALSDGTIDLIATDHAPHSPEEKKLSLKDAPFGIIGLQTILPDTYHLVRKSSLSFQRWIEGLTEQPAKLLNLETPGILKSRTANLTVFHPNQKWTFGPKNNQSKSQNSPRWNQEITGYISHVVASGQLSKESDSKKAQL